MAAPYRIEHLDHVQLAMPPGEEDRAVGFYEVLLGIPRVPKPAELAARGGCWFERDGLRVHLGVEQDFRPARKAHPALAVDGIDALCAALEAAGHPVRRAEDVPGTPQWYVDDPFGNRIELVRA
jgi:catechol 2,3-dioxygenase-like lactoylglutathione lyase family enzyme